MVNVYVNLIINGRRTIEDVTEKNGLREQVKAELVKRGYSELAGIETPVEEEVPTEETTTTEATK